MNEFSKYGRVMKALMSKLAKEIRNDPKGREGLNRFIKSGLDSMKIDLSCGKKYTITRLQVKKIT